MECEQKTIFPGVPTLEGWQKSFCRAFPRGNEGRNGFLDVPTRERSVKPFLESFPGGIDEKNDFRGCSHVELKCKTVFQFVPTGGKNQFDTNCTNSPNSHEFGGEQEGFSLLRIDTDKHGLWKMKA